MIQTKVHIHFAKVPVIAVFHLQNPYSFVDVKKNRARETNQGEMEEITGPVRGCFLSLYSESGKDLHAGVMGADGEF